MNHSKGSSLNIIDSIHNSVKSDDSPLLSLCDSSPSIPKLPSTIEPFEYIHENEYITQSLKKSNKKSIHQDRLGDDEMKCECTTNDPCTLNSQCLNRDLNIECGSNCPTGSLCQNRLFQNKQYANVQVQLTSGKGHGLFAMEDLCTIGTFISEYVGQILDKETFQSRAQKYDKEEEKHFYFMHINSDLIIDARQKGNFSRFMNHSCEPNCATEKWTTIQGETRIGFFTLKQITKGTELTFDYKFERFGTKAQKCLCGTPSCKGWIGIEKTSVTKSLSYSRGISEPDQMPKLVKDIIQEGERDQLLGYLKVLKSTTQQSCLKRFLHLHGLKILDALLVEYRRDPPIQYHILSILHQLPITNRASIEDAKLESKLEKFITASDTTLSELASNILSNWSKLEAAYRIPERSNDSNSIVKDTFKGTKMTPNIDLFKTLVSRKDEFLQSSKKQTLSIWTPNPVHHSSSKDVENVIEDHERIKDPATGRFLPKDWRSACTDDGKMYYYHIVTRETQWEFPEIKHSTSSLSISSTEIQNTIQKAKDHFAGQRQAQERQEERIQHDKEQVSKLREQIASIVVKYLSQYREQLPTANDDVGNEFKHLARKLTHHLLEKELSRPDHSISGYIDQKTLSKMHHYLKHYMRKLGYDDRKSSKRSRHK